MVVWGPEIHLAFHHVSKGLFAGAVTHPDRLRAIITWLLQNGYVIFTCGEYARRKRECTLPQKVATLSFDDGFIDQYTDLFPILKEFRVPATLFYIACTLRGEMPPVIGIQAALEHPRVGPKGVRQAVTDLFPETLYTDALDPKRRLSIKGRKTAEKPSHRRVKRVMQDMPQDLKEDLINHLFKNYMLANQTEEVRRRFMSGKMLREMVHSKLVEVASHTVTHPFMSTTSRRARVIELKDSRARLSKAIGKDVLTFGWPFGGQFSEEAMAAAGQVFDSCWNYSGNPKDYQAACARPFDPRTVPRLEEKHFEF